VLRTLGNYTAVATAGAPARYTDGTYTYYVWTATGSITV
jgi:hypothetical protein